MAKRIADYETVGDSCGACGCNLKEILEGPNKGQLFCKECLYNEFDSDAQFYEWLEYEND